MLKDGYTLDQKRDKIDGKGDIPDIIEKFRRREESNQSIFVTFEKIKQNDYNLSIGKYKKIESIETPQANPLKLIETLMSIENEISKTLSELKDSLS